MLDMVLLAPVPRETPPPPTAGAAGRAGGGVAGDQGAATTATLRWMYGARPTAAVWKACSPSSPVPVGSSPVTTILAGTTVTKAVAATWSLASASSPSSPPMKPVQPRFTTSQAFLPAAAVAACGSQTKVMSGCWCVVSPNSSSTSVSHMSAGGGGLFGGAGGAGPARGGGGGPADT